MDVARTDQSAIPKKLYRVICPNQCTYFDFYNGLIAGCSLPSQIWIDGSDLPYFYHTIRSHRDQGDLFSPYISLFESLSEAEMYCIAASDFHQDFSGRTCFIIEIDTRHPDMKETLQWLWYVHDIQVMCPPGVQLGEGPKDGLVGEGIKGGKFDSEWIFLFAIPGGGTIRYLKAGWECCVAQKWQGENELATIGPLKHGDSIKTFEQWMELNKLKVGLWELCGECKSEKGCEKCLKNGGPHGLRYGSWYDDRELPENQIGWRKKISSPKKKSNDEEGVVEKRG